MAVCGYTDTAGDTIVTLTLAASWRCWALAAGAFAATPHLLLLGFVMWADFNPRTCGVVTGIDMLKVSTQIAQSASKLQIRFSPNYRVAMQQLPSRSTNERSGDAVRPQIPFSQQPQQPN